MGRGYEQYCPVAKAAEILTRRWMPLVIRELLFRGRRFNEIRRGVPRISPGMLAQRLRELEEIGAIERRSGGDGHPEYHLTPAGEELRPIVVQMGIWGQRWARGKVSLDDLDPGLLIWDIRGRIRKERLPKRPVAVLFHFDDGPKDLRRFWLIADRADVDVCLKDPGHPVDLEVATSVGVLTQVWMGDVSYADALRRGGIRIDGPTRLRRAFPQWLGLSRFARVPRPPAPGISPTEFLTESQ